MTPTKPLPLQQQDYVKLSYTAQTGSKILAQQQHASLRARSLGSLARSKNPQGKKTADDRGRSFLPSAPTKCDPHSPQTSRTAGVLRWGGVKEP